MANYVNYVVLPSTGDKLERMAPAGEEQSDGDPGKREAPEGRGENNNNNTPERGKKVAMETPGDGEKISQVSTESGISTMDGEGAVPEGAVPEGVVPQGVVPQGAAPQGSAPQGPDSTLIQNPPTPSSGSLPRTTIPVLYSPNSTGDINGSISADSLLAMAPPRPPPPAKTLVAVDGDKAIQIYSTIPRSRDPREEEVAVPALDAERIHMNQIRTDGVHNPAFRDRDLDSPPPDGATDGAKDGHAKYGSDPKFRKKVSFNDAIVYNSERRTDITISGLHEGQSDTDDVTTLDRYSDNGRAHAQNGGIIPFTESSEMRSSSSRDMGHGQFPAHEGAVAGLDAAQGVRGASGRGAAKGKEYKCSLCVAVVLVSMAVIGLVILGTLYGLRTVPAETAVDTVETIRSRLQLRVPQDYGGLFRDALYRLASDNLAEGISYYLIQGGDVMTWQRPLPAATMIWLSGATVQVMALDGLGRLDSPVLGNPVEQEGAQHAIQMTNTSWYAGRLQDADSFALVGISALGSDVRWETANVTKLVKKFPQIAPKILEFTVQA